MLRVGKNLLPQVRIQIFNATNTGRKSPRQDELPQHHYSDCPISAPQNEALHVQQRASDVRRSPLYKVLPEPRHPLIRTSVEQPGCYHLDFYFAMYLCQPVLALFPIAASSIERWLS